MNEHTIRMSHAQTQFILTALRQCQMQGYFGADWAERLEIDALTDMIDALPDTHDADILVNDFNL